MPAKLRRRSFVQQRLARHAPYRSHERLHLPLAAMATDISTTNRHVELNKNFYIFDITNVEQKPLEKRPDLLQGLNNRGETEKPLE